MSTFYGNVPLPSGALGGAFCVKQGSAITGGNGSHGTVVQAGTTGAFIAGTALAGRSIMVLHETTTVGTAVTEAKVYLYQADDANGTNAAAVTNAVATFALTPAAGQIVQGYLPVDGILPGKYYALGVSWKASSGTNNTGTGGVIGCLLDPVYVS